MSAKKKKQPVKRVSSKPGRPVNFQEWALWRMRVRTSAGGDRKNPRQIIGASSRVLHRPPMYLELAAIINEDQYDWQHNATVASRELTRMRDEGLITCTDGWLITCTDGWWWRRQPHKLKAVK